MGPVLAGALHAAGRGWPVFPLRPGGKVPLIRAVHRPGDPCRGQCGQLGHGFHDATTNPAVIEAWWRTWPSANYGISTGPAGLVVIDLDTGKGTPPQRVLPDQGQQEATPDGIRDGTDVLAWAAQRDGNTGNTEAAGNTEDAGNTEAAGWKETLTVRTPSGGVHLYYAAPGGLEVRSSVGHTGADDRVRITGLGWSVDVRAAGGYVVGPGSLAPGSVPTGRNSSTAGYAATIPGGAKPLPGWLLGRLTGIGSVPDSGSDRTPCITGSVTTRPSSRPGVRIGAGIRVPTGYGNAAVAGELANIAASQPGGTGGSGRNATVNRAAFKLGRIVEACGLDAEDVAAQLLTAGQAVGLSAREAATAIASGLAQGRADPIPDPTRGRAAPARHDLAKSSGGRP